MMEWLQLLLPAWIMGTLLVFLTAPLGCLMLWRRMSFFLYTMAHGTLLGVAIAGALSLPLWLGVAGTAILLVAIYYCSITGNSLSLLAASNSNCH